jgi:cytochrome c oxidase cbb3-type subunit 2
MRSIGLLGPLERFVQRMLGGGCGMMGAGARPAVREERAIQPPPTSEPALVAAGKQVYAGNCAVCHGLGGDGQGMAAHMFSTQPRDFRPGVFKFRSTPSGVLPRDADLLRVLQRGVRRTAMVPQTHLSEAEQRAVIVYLKTLSPRWRKEEPEPPVPISEPPSRTPGLMAQGKQLYEQAGCAQCHGLDGRGDGPQAGDLKDDWGWPVRPANLQQRPLKGGSTLRDIYRTLATGLDGTPMPAVGDALAPDELWALVYYVDALAPPEARLDDETLMGEEARGRMVERMRGMMGGTMGRMPMMERMMRQRPERE